MWKLPQKDPRDIGNSEFPSRILLHDFEKRLCRLWVPFRCPLFFLIFRRLRGYKFGGTVALWNLSLTSSLNDLGEFPCSLSFSFFAWRLRGQ